MIRREIVLPAPREEVWDALTEPSGSRNGSPTTSSSTSGRAAAPASAGRTARAPRDGHRGRPRAPPHVRVGRRGRGGVHAGRRRRRHAPDGRRDDPGLDAPRSTCRPPRSRVSEPLNLVFGALADPSRRQVIGYLSTRHRDGDRADRRAADDAAGGREASRDARRRGPRRVGAPGPRDALPADRRGAEWDDRLDALRGTSSAGDSILEAHAEHLRRGQGPPARDRELRPRATRARGRARVHAPPHRGRPARWRRRGPRRGGRLRPRRTTAFPGPPWRAAVRGPAHTRFVLRPPVGTDRVPPLGVRVGGARPGAAAGRALARRGGRARVAAAPLRRLDPGRERRGLARPLPGAAFQARPRPGLDRRDRLDARRCGRRRHRRLQGHLPRASSARPRIPSCTRASPRRSRRRGSRIRR